jgi:prophage antirepressor-like protein
MESKQLEQLEQLNFFTYLNDKSIRVYGTPNEPWFYGNDVTKCLGYSKGRDAIAKHVDDDDRCKLQNTYTTNRGVCPNEHPNTILINESGLYSLILRSNKPNSKKFKRWVTSVVLPSLRKHGTYKMAILTPEQKEKLNIENFKNLLSFFQELGIDDRDKLFLKDFAMNKLVLKNGNNKELTLISKQYSVSRRLDEKFDLTGRKIAKLYIKAGRELCKKYRELYNTEPIKNHSFVNGAVRLVNTYFEDDWNTFGDSILEDVYSDFI